MTDVFNETMRSWQNFYFMIGGAAAALLGLMFVALSMGTHLVERTRASPDIFRAFVTPSINYFVSIILISGVMLVPIFTPTALEVILVVSGGFGVGRTISPVIKLLEAQRKHQDFNLWDWLTQIILPLVSYLFVVGAGIALAANVETALPFGALWLATLFLLICAIANTWGVVMWIVEQPRD